MHMADALLSVAVGGTMYACSGAASAYSVHKLRVREEELKVPVMGVMGSLVFEGLLIQSEPLRQSQSGTAECRVARCNRTGYHANNGEDTADRSQQCCGYLIHHAALPQIIQCIHQSAGGSVESNTCRRFRCLSDLRPAS